MTSLFDLHCDTLLEAYNQGLDFNDCNLHIPLNKANNFEPYVQVTSIWSDYRLDNDIAYKKACNVIDYYTNNGMNFCKSFKELGQKSFILGIEDARLLNNDISRLDRLFELGVRVLTLNWKGASCIGGGFDTNLGLTAFGKDVIKRCSELGVIVDVSHSSIATFYDALELSNKYGFVPIASHSNSFTVCNHPRNLDDSQFKALCEAGSIVGISLASEHLEKNASIYSIIKHILHYLALGGEKSISLGCDFDGVSCLPNGIKSICDLNKLYSLLQNEVGERIAKNIFFENPNAFFSKNF